MGYALKIYEAFEDLGKDKAAILAEFVEYIESRKAATSEELRNTELRLEKEIEEVRLELQKQIEEVRLEVEKVRREVEKGKSDLLKWMFVFWAGQIAAIGGLLISVLHWFLG